MGTPRVKIIHGDALDRLRRIPDASVAAVVTDPPYLLGFMGKAWDTRPAHEHLAWHTAWAAECLRILTPGGHLLAFGGTRTWHRMACAIEDAGFELRDTITWLYGSGFPKSLDVGKAITAHQTLGGSSRRQNRRAMTGDDSRSTSYGSGAQTATTTATSRPPVVANLTPEAQQWHGWGTALKPASEPIVVARKPLAGTVAANVLAHGTGALNIDATRTRMGEGEANPSIARYASTQQQGNNGWDHVNRGARFDDQSAASAALGRWPANVVLDGDAADALDEQSGVLKAPRSNGSKTQDGMLGTSTFKIHAREQVPGRADDGGASRFFPVFRYQAKAPTRERPSYTTEDGRKIAHPTVKPLELMRWLVRLVTPPGGTVVDPFAGSGTTGEAAWLEGFNSVLIENDPEAVPLIRQRMARLRRTA